MITCKKDLVNTYIENDSGVLRDVYVSLCRLHGVKTKGYIDYDILHVTKKLEQHGVCFGFESRITSEGKQLTLTDLLPTSYENTKVYNLDEDVIRKYAELCSYPEEVITGSSSIGIFIDDGFFAVRQFERNSQVDALEEFTTLTTEQILAAWDLRFGEEKTRTESEYQAVVNSRDDLQREVDGIEGLVKENTMNAEKLSIANQRISELESLKQDKQPKKMVEYVKCEFNDDKEKARAFIDGDIYFYTHGSVQKIFEDNMVKVKNLRDITTSNQLYRRTEVEIDWRDEVESRFSGIEFSKKYDSVMMHGPAWEKKSFIKMCHLVAELTDKPQ